MKFLNKMVKNNKFELNLLGNAQDFRDVYKAEDPGKELSKKIMKKTIMFFIDMTGATKILGMETAVEMAVEDVTGEYMDGYVDRVRKAHGVDFIDGDVRVIEESKTRYTTSNYYAFRKTKIPKYGRGITGESPVKIMFQKYKKRLRKYGKNNKNVTSNEYAFRKNKQKVMYGSNGNLGRLQKKISKRKVPKRKNPLVQWWNRYQKRLRKYHRAARYANGGFVNGMTLSYIGEEGPEAVIPLVSQRRQRGVELWEKTGSKLGVTQGSNSVNQKKKAKKSGQTINLLQILKEQRGQVSNELCSILADALEGAYKNIPMLC